MTDFRERYMRAMHAMQSGVAALMPSKETEPKHLRVGVNSALIDSAAVASLLIAKGVFTEDEYLEALALTAERDVATYTQLVRERYGNDRMSLE